MTLLEVIHYVAKQLDQTIIISLRVRTNKKVTIFTPISIANKNSKKYF